MIIKILSIFFSFYSRIYLFINFYFFKSWSVTSFNA